MRKERVKTASEQLDQLEVNWWNKNSGTIESVWAHSKEIRKAVRKHYIDRMKTFFRQGKSADESITILEIGCGSGWVGRMIADEKTFIVGTDISASQIKMAKDFAEKENLQSFTSYTVTNAATFTQAYDGVLIHALLHHLSEVELEGFFAQIRKLKKGTKVFLYEATYVPHRPGGFLPSRIVDLVSKIYQKFVFALIHLRNGRNQALWTELNNLLQDAQKNGWDLSPKEVPFRKAELMNYLNQYFVLENEYPVNRLDFEIGQRLMLHDLDQPGWIFSTILFPIARLLDRLFFKTNYQSVLGRSGQNYLFGCYELRLK